MWNLDLLLLSPLVLLTSFNKICLSLISEKISDLIVPRLTDWLYTFRVTGDKQVEKLVELGFDKERAEEALQLHDGNLENAATWLLSG